MRRDIARTEVLKANQNATIEGFRQSGVVTRKMWLSSRDSKVRDSHRELEGMIVPLNETFDVNGTRAAAPGAIGLPASEVIKCRCTLVGLGPE